MQHFSIVILAAGMGTRLGRPFPKPLTQLGSGRSIMQSQLDNIERVFPGSAPHIVVGFKKELIMEQFPDAVYLYNADYYETNTSKSLLRALLRAAPGGILWLNGDVVFQPEVLEQFVPFIERDQSVVSVNRASVGEEEVKYTVDDDGFVLELSKTVQGALGEAVGINYVSGADRPTLLRHLDACGDQDYFERAIETAIAAEKLRVCSAKLLVSLA